MKKILSPTELRRARKLKIQEEEEKIEAMGSESEAEGRKATQEIMAEEKKKEEKKREDELNRLDMNRKKVFTYKEMLQYTLHALVFNIGMPKEYSWGVWFDGRGIVLAIRDRKGVLHKRAFRPSTDPELDQNAIKTFALWAEDVYDKCEGKLESPIWTPKN